MAKRTKKQPPQKKGWGGARDGSGRKLGIPIKAPKDKAVTVSLSMSGELHRQLKERAEARDVTVNDAIRESIRDWITKKGTPPNNQTQI